LRFALLFRSALEPHLDAERGICFLSRLPQGRDKLFGILPKDWEVGCYSCGCLDRELLLLDRYFVLCFLALDDLFIQPGLAADKCILKKDQTYCNQ
jgi:hypothetical protein